MSLENVSTSSVSYNELIRMLSNSDIPNERKIADLLEQYGVEDPDAVGEGFDVNDVENEVTQGISNALKIRNAANDPSAWNENEIKGYTNYYTLSDFDENSHPTSQSVVLYREKGKLDYTLVINAGSVFHGIELEHHAETEYKYTISASGDRALRPEVAKKRAADIIEKDILPENVLYTFN